MSIIRDYENETGNSVFASDNQEILRKFVGREVISNVSMLVNHFVQNEEALNGSDYDYEEILDLCLNPDYEEAGREYLSRESRKNLLSILDDYPDNHEEVKDSDENETIIFLIENEITDWQDFCEDQDIEPIEKEALEHWIVSDFLKRQLEEKGEIVGELFNMDIWGRTASGQAILLDPVIAEIACEMEILVGQKYEWKYLSVAIP